MVHALSQQKMEMLRERVRHFQIYAISYTTSPEKMYADARKLMLDLKSSHAYILYFSVWDMYVQQLYYNEHQLAAQNELRKMLDEISKIDNPEAAAHVYISQGMLKMRFGEYKNAEEVFRKGLNECPPLEQCRFPRSRLILYRWLIQTKLFEKSNYEETLKLCDEQDKIYHTIVRLKRGDEYSRDYVEINAQRAATYVGLKRMSEAKTLLDSCRARMVLHAPIMIYLQYFQALITYYKETGDYDNAINVCTMLASHFSHGYRPLQRQYVRIKAELLRLAGRNDEAAATFHSYVMLDDSINVIRISNDMKELEMQYGIYRLNLQSDRDHSYMLLLTIVVAFLLIVAGICFWFYLRSRHKNRILVNRMEEIRLFLPTLAARETDEDKDAEKNSTSKQLNEYLESDNHLQDCLLTSSQIAADLHVTLPSLNKALHDETGLFVSEYLMKMRLEKARMMLIHHPNNTIQGIAFSCGYNTQRTFQRHFNQTYGMTPTAYRQAFIENSGAKE
jgi:AraC-like DNA-binding protein